MILKTELDNKIAKEFFKGFTTQAEVTRRLFPDSKKKVESSVQRLFNKLDEKGYITEKSKPKNKINKKGNVYFQKILMYKLNLNFFFDYINKNLPKENYLKDNEKEFLEFIVKLTFIRNNSCRYKNLNEGVLDSIYNLLTYEGYFDNLLIFAYRSRKYLGDEEEIDRIFQNPYEASSYKNPTLRKAFIILKEFGEKEAKKKTPKELAKLNKDFPENAKKVNLKFLEFLIPKEKKLVSEVTRKINYVKKKNLNI